MRVDGVKGLWVRYKFSGTPTEVFDRVTYAFRVATNHECLVTNPRHIELLLLTGKYLVSGVEVEPPAPDPESIPKHRGRPPKHG